MARTDEMGKDGTMDKLVKVSLFDFKSDVLAARPYSPSQPSLTWTLPPAPQILVPSASVWLIFLNLEGWSKVGRADRSSSRNREYCQMGTGVQAGVAFANIMRTPQQWRTKKKARRHIPLPEMAMAMDD